MIRLHKSGSTKQLAKMGWIESLAGREIMFHHITQCQSLNVVKRFSYGKDVDLRWGLYGACKTNCEKIIDWIITGETCTATILVYVQLSERKYGIG